MRPHPHLVRDFPRLVGPGGEDFDRAGISPYSFRHTFAQRLADPKRPHRRARRPHGPPGNCPPPRATTGSPTSGSAKRSTSSPGYSSTAAPNEPAPVERLLESEHLRESVGQVAVPFGICVEPTNVKAQGQACPFRHQCFGCTHYRTDPSFLPELQRLSQPSARRQRTAPGRRARKEWARNAAIPSQDEIAAVRDLIGRCEKLPLRAGRGRTSRHRRRHSGVAPQPSPARHHRAGALPRRHQPLQGEAVPQHRPRPPQTRP